MSFGSFATTTSASTAVAIRRAPGGPSRPRHRDPERVRRLRRSHVTEGLPRGVDAQAGIAAAARQRRDDLRQRCVDALERVLARELDDELAVAV